MPDVPCDDVIAIRVDAARAVADFLALLARQAAEGESAQPANPANRAVFRELAPYRLVEYEYIDPAVGPVEGAYVGFPDGGIYSCGEVIPEEAVDGFLSAGGAALPPLYVYVLLAKPAGAAALGAYQDALATHLGMPVVGVIHGADGGVTAGLHAGDALLSAAERAVLGAVVRAAAAETGRHLAKATVLARHAGSSLRPDGRAYAHLTHRFSRRILEFATPAERDSFVAWSQAFCRQAPGEAPRPAEPCAAPPASFKVIRLPPPPADPAMDGEYWAGVTAAIDAVIAAEQAAMGRRERGSPQAEGGGEGRGA